MHFFSMQQLGCERGAPEQEPLSSYLAERFPLDPLAEEIGVT